MTYLSANSWFNIQYVWCIKFRCNLSVHNTLLMRRSPRCIAENSSPLTNDCTWEEMFKVRPTSVSSDRQACRLRCKIRQVIGSNTYSFLFQATTSARSWRGPSRRQRLVRAPSPWSYPTRVRKPCITSAATPAACKSLYRKLFSTTIDNELTKTYENFSHVSIIYIAWILTYHHVTQVQVFLYRLKAPQIQTHLPPLSGSAGSSHSSGFNESMLDTFQVENPLISTPGFQVDSPLGSEVSSEIVRMLVKGQWRVVVLVYVVRNLLE